MDAEGVRAIVKKLPHVAETVQWGDNLVFWVGDKSQGGKMFALVDLSGAGKAVMSWAANRERGAELLEHEGMIPAPYLARAGWVALERWDALTRQELTGALRDAHAYVLDRMPRRVREALTTRP